MSLAVCSRRAVVLVSTRRIGCGLAAAVTDAAAPAAAGSDLRVTLAGVCVRSSGPPTARGWLGVLGPGDVFVVPKLGVERLLEPVDGEQLAPALALQDVVHGLIAQPGVAGDVGDLLALVFLLVLADLDEPSNDPDVELKLRRRVRFERSARPFPDDSR